MVSHGIPGDVTTGGHEKWIELTSGSWASPRDASA